MNRIDVQTYSQSQVLEASWQSGRERDREREIHTAKRNSHLNRCKSTPVEFKRTRVCS